MAVLSDGIRYPEGIPARVCSRKPLMYAKLETSHRILQIFYFSINSYEKKIDGTRHLETDFGGDGRFEVELCASHALDRDA